MNKKRKIADMESYIAELELLPDEPKYKEAKEHFELVSCCNMD
jgi:hypothetical protein